MKVETANGSQKQKIAEAQQILYDYLLESVQQEAPDRLIEDFRRLFVEGRGYRDAKIFSALETIVKTKDLEESFNFFFNRCCYILINRWQIQPQLQSAIPELVGQLDNLAPALGSYPSTSNRLRHLVKEFTASEHYVKLQRLARVIDGKHQNVERSHSVGSLIHRYPYLYDHCLLSDESSQEHQKTVRRLKSKLEKNFEVDLSHYVTYKVRLAQTAPIIQGAAQNQRIIQPVNNPTLLSDRELHRSLTHFTGTVEGGYTYKSLSHNFLSHTTHTPTFQDFKDDLYEYLTGSIEPQYGKGRFNKKLYQLLQNTVPECDRQKPTEFLKMRASSQLLNFLIVESSRQPEHYVFIDMITNMGVTRTIGVLLKVVLMCNKIKPYLEKRFSILFNHYESFTSDGVPWLVKALEHLHIAFTVHFGKVDLSCLKQIQ